MEVLVTGASGFIGRAVAAALADAGHRVVAVSRDPESARRVLPPGCVCIGWDGRTLPALPTLPDAVLHLAGAGIADRRWTKAVKAEILRSRAETGRQIIRSLAEQGKKPAVAITASAIGIYPESTGADLTEESAAGGDFLAGVCRAWEEPWLEWREGRVLVLRLGVVLGPDGGALARMLPLFRAGLGGRLGHGRQWMSWIHRDDVCRIILQALEDERYRGIVNAVAPGAVTNREFTRLLAARLRRPALLPVPAAALRLVLGEMATAVLADQHVVPARLQDYGFAFQYGDLQEALQDLLPG